MSRIHSGFVWPRVAVPTGRAGASSALRVGRPIRVEICVDPLLLVGWPKAEQPPSFFVLGHREVLWDEPAREERRRHVERVGARSLRAVVGDDCASPRKDMVHDTPSPVAVLRVEPRVDGGVCTAEDIRHLHKLSRNKMNRARTVDDAAGAGRAADGHLAIGVAELLLRIHQRGGAPGLGHSAERRRGFVDVRQV